ncbi:MAG TPA: hypothetical protein VLD59_06105, partial [Steroidobacteraceae bacterium]|nr:hypothetical protein [Steroidobacteraceae bacterium]
MSFHSRPQPRRLHALLVLLTTGMAVGTGLVVATPASGTVLPSIGARTAEQSAARPPWIPSDAELERSGATIGEVVIVPEDVFDTDDSNDDATLFRVVNHLHISTRPETIESQLLFTSGQAYSGHALAESERILRSSRYLYDASIRPVSYHDGVVDVEVRSRDVWTLTPGFSFGRSGGKNTASLELEELNLFGRGTQLSVGAVSGVDRDSKSIIYRDRQLFDSWWGLSMELS